MKLKRFSGRIKAQAALEFLMTYGWAILVVLIVIGALSYFGVLTPANLMPERCNLEPGMSCSDFKYSPNGASIELKNSLGKQIIIEKVSIKTHMDDVCYIESAKKITHGKSGTFTLVEGDCDFSNYDTKIRSDIVIDYRPSDSSISKTITGSVYGKMDKVNIEMMQEISLSNGWNRVSFHVDPGVYTIPDFFYEINEPAIREIQDSSGEATYSSATGTWTFSGLSTIDPMHAYEIYAHSATTIKVMGPLISDDTRIYLTSGWNYYVPYFPRKEILLTTALSELIDQGCLQKVMDEEGKFFLPGSVIGGLVTMKPGEGYKIQVNSDCSFVYNTG